MCPVDVPCFSNRSIGFPCKYPQGIFEPMACPHGFYCPDHKTVLLCPEGHYCVTGQFEPTPCEFLSICNVGSIVQRHYGVLLLVGIVDVLLLLVYAILRFREMKLANSQHLPSPDAKTIDKDFIVADGAQVGTELVGVVAGQSGGDVEIKNNISALTAGFHKGLDGRDDLQMNYEFDGLSLTLPDGKTILQGVSGSINAGRMTAIMGPSGAGKTTFMNVLMGKVARTSGTLKINNSVAEMRTFKKIIGYVPQEDVMIEELTVRENIRYSARTRLPDSWSNKEVDDHVDAILKALNLSNVAHKRIGNVLERGISGGQRKRVNIGMELAAAPLSVFLDEPTSGLDSTAALDSVNILSSISRLGLTIVAVIHQPRVEIFESFDDVLMIAPGGRTAYFGPVSGAKPYFESLGFLFGPASNDADTLMDILAGRGQTTADVPKANLTANHLVEHWNQRVQSFERGTPNVSAETSIDSMNKIAKLRGASFIRQIGLAHNRSVKQQARLVSGFVLELFIGFLSGGIMGFASFGGENLSSHLVEPYTAISTASKTWFIGMYGMLVGIAISLASAPAGVKVFSEEKAVYLREHEAGHSISAYFIGKNLSTVYRIAISSAHFVSLYVLLAQPPIGTGTQYLLLALNFFGVYGMGQAVSMMVRRENAPLLAVTTSLISGVLCGFGPQLNDATKDGYVFILNIGVNRWMAEAQFWEWAAKYEHVFDEMILENAFGYKKGNTTRNLLVMLALGFAYRVLAYLVLLLTLNSGLFRSIWAKFGLQKRSKPVKV
ncbi:P-loop containing nucleoside triphosphate hydrolase protein [Obelidium mucronatum]|nr:P-loop containing nucleoside triphosphate hydrolase protein [Obelidium mucronatum]